ncbi:nitroreductase family deazaflavin-dependent oxidoreductase [Amycolatopsis endophytica]|uniref:Deazaflavin-dependent oxidoreductase (Nitroreductase family) n=1 Tax=Amycolatopsis endophytica TaxID=860233 RepID=A0A853B7V8_9PSEU|nr:nitroreductase family deazaflavin-dependent oxidoreductase [Amycolatopsis endophytica]NYI91393.1 deazaflavin-dependent oxidoreductase (nitroreductase family) [Amycolatopsis endophytica]
MGLTDHTPSGLLRAMFRAPVPLYRLGFGPLFGHRLVYLAHRGRKSGRRREVILEVVRFDARLPEVVVVSGWGERADWYRNIQAAPALEVRISARRWAEPRQRVLEQDETVKLLQDYRDRHPRAWRRLAPLLGFPPDPAGAREALSRIRAVAFTPRNCR